MKQLTIETTAQQQFVEITKQVEKVVKTTGMTAGVVHLFIPHTTAGITINENCDPDVCSDMLDILEKAVPTHGEYRHQEGNSHSHAKASLMGNHTTVIVVGGRMVLGTWQGIFLAEFDGPRSRTVLVKPQPDS